MDRDVRAAVVLGDRLLPSRSLHLGDRQAREAGLEQIRADRLEGLVTDVGNDHLHAGASPVIAVAVAPAGAGAATRPLAGRPEPMSSDGGMNCSGYPYKPVSEMSSPASSSSGETRRPIVALMT